MTDLLRTAHGTCGICGATGVSPFHIRECPGTPNPPTPNGHTARGCAVGLGCIVLVLLAELSIVGLAALRILGLL